jgi:hypothetical protein
MKQHWLTTTAGSLSFAVLAVVVTAAVILFNQQKSTRITASPAQNTQPQLIQGNGAFTIDGTYSGEVTLTWVLGGLYSDPLPTPTPAPSGTPVALNLGSVDLSFQLSQSGNAVSGHVNLAQTLIVSTVHKLNDGTETGPAVNGTINGQTLTLTSERFQTMLDGEIIERQLRLIGQVDAANENIIVGEYRETFWGLTDQPSTAIGAFTLQRPAVNAATVDNNRAPDAVADRVTTEQGKAVTIAVLANDSDADGDPLTVTAVSKPQFGTATTDGQSVLYTSQAGFVGVDNFSYFVSDSKGDAVAGSVIVTVHGPSGPNRVPTASNDTATTSPGIAVTIDVLRNDSDPDGDPLTITIETQPSNGIATVVSGKLVYTPNPGFAGTDTIRYTISDGKGGVSTATVTVTVTDQPGGGSDSLYLPLIQR